MAYDNVIYEVKDRVGIVTLNRPEIMNALAPGMGEDVAMALKESEDNPDVMVHIVTGAGRGFCAGAYVMKDENTHSLDHPSDRLLNQSKRGGVEIWDCRKPVIAAVNGAAYGAGFGMTAACDIIIASTAARFCLPFMKLGIIPGGGGGGGGMGPRLALSVGKSKASEMVLMARPVDGEDAYRWGYANAVVEPEQLMDTAMSWAIEITKLAPLSLILAKEDLRESWVHHTNKEANTLRFMACQLTDDRREGHAAVRERRDGVFTGR